MKTKTGYTLSASLASLAIIMLNVSNLLGDKSPIFSNITILVLTAIFLSVAIFSILKLKHLTVNYKKQ
ncbi:MAG: hypothetical protein QM500_15640 [Methylococcales bacterium]